MAVITLSIDGKTREMLRSHAVIDGSSVSDFGLVVPDDRIRALELQEIASQVIELLEALGWEENDERERYEVTVDRDLLRGWLQDKRHELEGVLGSLVVTLAQQERGEEQHYYENDQEESVRTTRGYIEQPREEIEAIGSLLSDIAADAPATRCAKAVA